MYVSNKSGSRRNVSTIKRPANDSPTIAVSYSEAAHTAGAAETLPAWAMATHTSNVPAEGALPAEGFQAVG